jgi:hypothetical protein
VVEGHASIFNCLHMLVCDKKNGSVKAETIFKIGFSILEVISNLFSCYPLPFESTALWLLACIWFKRDGSSIIAAKSDALWVLHYRKI